jgi:hypothetical protein
MGQVVEAAFQMGQKTVCASEEDVIYFHEMEQRNVVSADFGVLHPRPVRRHVSFGRSVLFDVF